jgi:hypothetical protein
MAFAGQRVCGVSSYRAKAATGVRILSTRKPEIAIPRGKWIALKSAAAPDLAKANGPNGSDANTNGLSCRLLSRKHHELRRDFIHFGRAISQEKLQIRKTAIRCAFIVYDYESVLLRAELGFGSWCAVACFDGER